MDSRKPIKPDRDSRTLTYLTIISLIALGVSIYLVKDHYEDEENSFCDMNDIISCKKIRRSAFSELLGIPVAILGVIYNVVAVLLPLRAMAVRDDLADYSDYASAIYYWAVCGGAFVVYLVLAEIWLHAICPMCTVIHILQVITLYFAYKLVSNLRTRPSFISVAWNLKVWLVGLTIVGLTTLVLVHISPAGNFPQVIEREEFARCVTEKGWRMVGVSGCSWCERQKLLFGDTFKHIIFVDCKEENCERFQLKGYPTWIQEKDGAEIKRWSGYASYEDIKIFTECDFEETIAH